jgi:hypothetical protein
MRTADASRGPSQRSTRGYRAEPSVEALDAPDDGRRRAGAILDSSVGTPDLHHSARSATPPPIRRLQNHEPPLIS